ncbi:MAG: topoisomerase C-terminal repeat-containing protein, partial [Candidatus Caldatribacteriaceae bacterium]
GKNLSRRQVQELLLRKRTGRISGFRSRKGKKFAACLVLGEDGKVEFEFTKNAGVKVTEKKEGE